MSRVARFKVAPVAAEGRGRFLAACAAVLLAGGLYGAATLLVSLPLLGIVAWYYRDPHRQPPPQPLAVVAPADGVVVAAGAVFDPWLGRPAHAVSVVSRWDDVHGVYGPIEARIVEQWSAPRRAAGALSAGAVGYLLRTDEGDELVLEIARLGPAGSLRFAYQPGERIGHGRRVGFAPSGCRTTVYCASETRLEVRPGVRVRGAESVLMSLLHEGPVTALGTGDAA